MNIKFTKIHPFRINFIDLDTGLHYSIQDDEDNEIGGEDIVIRCKEQPKFFIRLRGGNLDFTVFDIVQTLYEYKYTKSRTYISLDTMYFQAFLAYYLVPNLKVTKEIFGINYIDATQ